MIVAEKMDVRKCPIGENRPSDKQRQAIDLLLGGAKLSDIASELQIDLRTLYRWRGDRRFRRAMSRRRGEVLAESADRIRAMLSPAVDVVHQQLSTAFDRPRFRAATTILRLCGIQKALSSRRGK